MGYVFAAGCVFFEGESRLTKMDREHEPTEQFTRRVGDYERYRLRYPPAVLALLRDQCGLSVNDVIADIGAGTGMLAQIFLEHGNAVAAIEPNASMRAACERLLGSYAQLRVVDATAEATTLEEGSIDFVTAGRAFHWFNTELALREFQRVLQPLGWVVLAANGRGQGTSEQALDYERLLTEHGIGHQGMGSRYRTHEVAAAAFAPGTLVQEELRGEQQLTLVELIGQTQSFSSAPLLGEAKYAGMQRALREHFARWEKDGVIEVETACLLTCGQFHSISSR